MKGGYNFRSISKSALAVTRTLMGEAPNRWRAISPSTQAKTTVHRVMSIQAQYWQCMSPKPPQHPVWADRLHGMCFPTIDIGHRCVNEADDAQMSFVNINRNSSMITLNSHHSTFTAPPFPSLSRIRCWQGKRE